MSETWKTLKMKGQCMTRIAACTDGKELIVGSDTLLTNSINGNKSESHKLFCNKKGIVVAALGAIEFNSSLGDLSIKELIEIALNNDNTRDVIDILIQNLCNFYKIYDIEGFFTQIIVFWRTEYGYSFFPFEVGKSGSEANYNIAPYLFFPYGNLIDDKNLIMNNRLLLAGDGVDGNLYLIKVIYNENIVKENIISAINDADLATIGGHYEYLKICKNGEIESNIKK